MTAPTAQFDGIWLQSRNYAVVPLNSQLAGRISEFERAIQRGVPASPDSHRHDFYNVELENGCAGRCADRVSRRLFLLIGQV